MQHIRAYQDSIKAVEVPIGALRHHINAGRSVGFKKELKAVTIGDLTLTAVNKLYSALLKAQSLHKEEPSRSLCGEEGYRGYCQLKHCLSELLKLTREFKAKKVTELKASPPKTQQATHKAAKPKTSKVGQTAPTVSVKVAPATSNQQKKANRDVFLSDQQIAVLVGPLLWKRSDLETLAAPAASKFESYQDYLVAYSNYVALREAILKRLTSCERERKLAKAQDVSSVAGSKRQATALQRQNVLRKEQKQKSEREMLSGIFREGGKVVSLKKKLAGVQKYIADPDYKEYLSMLRSQEQSLTKKLRAKSEKKQKRRAAAKAAKDLEADVEKKAELAKAKLDLQLLKAKEAVDKANALASRKAQKGVAKNSLSEKTQPTESVSAAAPRTKAEKRKEAKSRKALRKRQGPSGSGDPKATA